MAGLMAGLRLDGPPMSNVSQVRAAVARSKARGRVAIIIADNLKTHTAQGSLLVRSIVTHNHHRKDFDALLADAGTHFETLARTPDDLLRHLGSPFAPDRRPTQSQALAA